MQLKTILNSVTNYKSFVFGKIEIVETIFGKSIEAEVLPRKNGQRICSGCSKVRPGYDTMPEVVPIIRTMRRAPLDGAYMPSFASWAIDFPRRFAS